MGFAGTKIKSDINKQYKQQAIFYILKEEKQYNVSKVFLSESFVKDIAS